MQGKRKENIGIYNVFVLYLECFENLAINYKVNEAGIVVGIQLCFSSHKRKKGRENVIVCILKRKALDFKAFKFFSFFQFKFANIKCLFFFFKFIIYYNMCNLLYFI